LVPRPQHRANIRNGAEVFYRRDLCLLRNICKPNKPLLNNQNVAGTGTLLTSTRKLSIAHDSSLKL
jgi:hypothetical protein